MESTSEVARRALETYLPFRLRVCLQLRWERRCGRCSPAAMIQIVHSQCTYRGVMSLGAAVFTCLAFVRVNTLCTLGFGMVKRHSGSASDVEYPVKL